MKTGDRFTVSLKERAIRWSGCYDRFWVIFDNQGRKTQVARFHVDYPKAEKLARSWAKGLNREFAKQKAVGNA